MMKNCIFFKIVATNSETVFVGDVEDSYDKGIIKTKPTGIAGILDEQFPVDLKVRPEEDFGYDVP